MRFFIFVKSVCLHLGEKMEGRENKVDSEVRQLKEERDQLKKVIDQLEAERDQMKTERDQLEAERDQMKEERDQLLKNIDDVIVQLLENEKKMEFKKGLSFCTEEGECWSLQYVDKWCIVNNNK